MIEFVRQLLSPTWPILVLLGLGLITTFSESGVAQDRSWDEVDEVPEHVWPRPLALDPDDVMVVSEAIADSTIRAFFRHVERYNTFRIIAVTPDSVLYAWLDLEAGRYFGGEASEGASRIMRSRDGGRIWEPVFLRPDALGRELVWTMNPHDSLRPLIGTPDGLFVGYVETRDFISPGPPPLQIIAMPSYRTAISAVLADPHRPGVIYAATRERFSERVISETSILTSKPSLLRGTLESDLYAGWNELYPLPDGQIVQLGIAPDVPDWLYARLADGRVMRRLLPEPYRPEDFGWERLAAADMPPHVSFERPVFDATPFLDVTPEYANTRVLIREHGAPGIPSPLRYLYAQDGGVLYGYYSVIGSGIEFWNFLKSVDGGLAWSPVAGFSGDRDLICRNCIVDLLDVRGNFLFDTERFNPRPTPNTWAPEPITAWTQDPIDPLIYYLGQESDEMLFRRRDEHWEAIGEGLPFDLRINSMTVDSSATLYVRMSARVQENKTHVAIFRRPFPLHPFALENPQIQPDTLLKGNAFTITVKRIPRAAIDEGQVPIIYTEYRGERILMVDDGRTPDAVRGDEIYTGQGRLNQGHRVGYDGLPVLLDIAGKPLAGASTRASFVVVPDQEIPIYDGQLAEAWTVEADDGLSDLHAEAPGPKAGFAHRIENDVAYRYQARGPFPDPFGYDLAFQVWSESSDAKLRINDFVLSEENIALSAGVWTSVSIPFERLYDTTPTEYDALTGVTYGVALLKRIKFSAAEPIYLDQVRLVPPAVQTPTAVNEERGATNPDRIFLGQNYPNPFNAQTSIPYQTAQSGPVQLVIYNVLGQPVRTLVKGRQETGLHRAVWDGKTDAGQTTGSGLYFYRLQTPATVQVRQLILLK